MPAVEFFARLDSDPIRLFLDGNELRPKSNFQACAHHRAGIIRHKDTQIVCQL
jgi:hypothetical protein